MNSIVLVGGNATALGRRNIIGSWVPSQTGGSDERNSSLTTSDTIVLLATSSGISLKFDGISVGEGC